MRDQVIVTTTTEEDLKLIIEALSAYQHNTRYRALYQKLVLQIERRAEAGTTSAPCAQGQRSLGIRRSGSGG